MLARPSLFFGSNSELPAQATLRFELPDVLVHHYGRSGAKQAILQATARHEHKAREQIAARKWRVLGPERCTRVSPYQRARCYEVFGSREPTFATKGGGKDAFIVAAGRLRRFRAQYRTALERWREGARDVVFPLGTWWMRVFHAVKCAPLPAPS